MTNNKMAIFQSMMLAASKKSAKKSPEKSLNNISVED